MTKFLKLKDMHDPDLSVHTLPFECQFTCKGILNGYCDDKAPRVSLSTMHRYCVINYKGNLIVNKKRSKLSLLSIPVRRILKDYFRTQSRRNLYNYTLYDYSSNYRYY